MTASSLRPMRRFRTSSRPAAASKDHPAAPLTRGTGKGQASLPRTSSLRSGPDVPEPPALGHRRHEHLAVPPAGGRVRCVDEVLPGGAEEGDQAVHVVALTISTSALAASSGVAKTRGLPPGARAARQQQRYGDRRACPASRARRPSGRSSPAPPRRRRRRPSGCGCRASWRTGSSCRSSSRRRRRSACRCARRSSRRSPLPLSSRPLAEALPASCLCSEPPGPGPAPPSAAASRCACASGVPRASCRSVRCCCAAPRTARRAAPARPRPARTARPPCPRGGPPRPRARPRGSRSSPRARPRGRRTSRSSRRCTCRRRRASRTARSSSCCRSPRRSRRRRRSRSRRRPPRRRRRPPRQRWSSRAACTPPAGCTAARRPPAGSPAR